MMSKSIYVLAALLLITLLSACGSPSPNLLDTQWQWASITDGIAQNLVENPEDYVLVFNQDGTFSGKMDCNLISGTYEMDETMLTISTGPTTLAECGPDSRYESLLGKLELVERYEIKDSSVNNMTLFLSDGSTRLGFKNGGPAE
jgi:hypothetical protein